MPVTPAAQSDAIHDDTLVEWFLSLPPAERLAELESRLAFFDSARLNADIELPPDSRDA